MELTDRDVQKLQHIVDEAILCGLEAEADVEGVCAQMSAESLVYFVPSEVALSAYDRVGATPGEGFDIATWWEEVEKIVPLDDLELAE